MKCELVCSFLYEPKVIFLDEPTIGLDVNSAKEVRKFLKETNKSLGTTIILTTHNMEDVEELCDRTIVINKGEKIYDGQTAELKKIFGDNRVIEFIFEENSSQTPSLLVHELTNTGAEILENTSQKLLIKIDRAQTATVINKIMNTLQVHEINFQEDDLSDVIAKVYKQ
jgi:ABC-2 type transport system ATP-binding protein